MAVYKKHTIELTYDEWQQLGYVVRKGEKAYIRYNGVPLFTYEQVVVDVEIMAEILDAATYADIPTPVDLDDIY